MLKRSNGDYLYGRGWDIIEELPDPTRNNSKNIMVMWKSRRTGEILSTTKAANLQRERDLRQKYGSEYRKPNKKERSNA